MVKVSRFRVKGARYILLRENGKFYDVALSRYPVWGTAIKHFRRINHINIENGILASDKALISKLKEEELSYSMRLPLQVEEEEIEIELHELNDGIRTLAIYRPEIEEE